MTVGSITPNLITRAIELVAPKIAELGEAEREAFEVEMDITPAELAHWQERKSLAYMAGTLTLDEANIIYRALGYGGANGGWPTRTDLPTKVAVTLVMGRVLAGGAR